MIIDRRLIGIRTPSYFAHRCVLETSFGKYVGRMIEQRLASEFSRFYHYNFFAREIAASPAKSTFFAKNAPISGTARQESVAKCTASRSGRSCLISSGAPSMASSTVATVGRGG